MSDKPGYKKFIHGSRDLTLQGMTEVEMVDKLINYESFVGAQVVKDFLLTYLGKKVLVSKYIYSDSLGSPNYLVYQINGFVDKSYSRPNHGVSEVEAIQLDEVQGILELLINNDIEGEVRFWDPEWIPKEYRNIKTIDSTGDIPEVIIKTKDRMSLI